MTELKLLINNKMVPIITANLSFSIEQLAHSFTCTITPLEITGPLPVSFYLDDALIFVGQIDACSISTGSISRTQTLSGRSISAHLIDSRIKTDALYNQKFDTLLANMVKQFGLEVKNNVQTSLPLIPEFQINAESPFQNLSQIAKQQGLMLYEYNGVIRIEKPGQFRAKNLRLEQGVNLKDTTIQYNWSKLFNRYEIQGAWDNSQATVINDSVSEYRKKVIISDKLQNQESCQARAKYENDLAIAQNLIVTGSVPGLQSVMNINALNKTVQFVSKQENINENLLIKSININVNGSEHSTGIELMRPFAEEPLS